MPLALCQEWCWVRRAGAGGCWLDILVLQVDEQGTRSPALTRIKIYERTVNKKLAQSVLNADTDSLIDQTLLRFSWTLSQLGLIWGLPCLSLRYLILARILLCQFNRTPFLNIWSPCYLIRFLVPYHPQWSPWMIFGKIQFGWLSHNPFSPDVSS